MHQQVCNQSNCLVDQYCLGGQNDPGDVLIDGSASAFFDGGTVVVLAQSLDVEHVGRKDKPFLLQSDVANQDCCSGESSFQGKVLLLVAVAAAESDSVESAAVAAVVLCVGYVVALVQLNVGQGEDEASEKHANHWQGSTPDFDFVHEQLEYLTPGQAVNEAGGPLSWQLPGDEEYMGEAGMGVAFSVVWCCCSVRPAGTAVHGDVLGDSVQDEVVQQMVQNGVVQMEAGQNKLEMGEAVGQWTGVSKTVLDEGELGDAVVDYELIEHDSSVGCGSGLQDATAYTNVVPEADSVGCLQTGNVGQPVEQAHQVLSVLYNLTWD